MRSAFAAFFCLLVFSSVRASTESDTYVKQLETAYKRAHTLEAKFLQRYSEGGRVTRSETGTAYFRRPGRMRWEYESPERNLFVVDGKFAWFYVPADHTVSRVPSKESDDWRTPLALLAGEMKVSRVCSRVGLSAEQPNDGILIRLDCSIRGSEKEAKSGRPHDTAFFEINKSSGELSRLVVSSSGGVRMEMQFSDWKFNPPANEELFHFQPPKGVAIVDADQIMTGAGPSVP